MSPSSWAYLLLLLFTLQALSNSATNAADLHANNPINKLEEQIQLHQEALASYCAQYQTAKLRQLDYLIEFEVKNEQVHLPSPIRVPMPAACVLLLDQFGLIPKTAALPEMEEPLNGTSKHKPLELVNWLYADHEQAVRDQVLNRIRHPNGSAICKREADASPSVAEQRELLSSYLLDLNKAEGNEIEVEEPQLAKFHQDINKLMTDGRFGNAINSNRGLISARLSPIVLIPGLLGSRLQGRLDKPQRVNSFCSKQADWKDLWLSLRNFLPILFDCWMDNVRMEFDPVTGWTKQPEGVESRVPDFGSLDSVRFLDMRSPKMTKYFSEIIDHYTHLGYTPDENLLAAPYDFRLAPQQMGDYFNKLARLIEKAHTQNGNPVTLVCHSMGCTHAFVFLRQQGEKWRSKRIRKLIALSSPWGGSMKALKALVVGDRLEMPLVRETKMRELARTFPSMAYLLPQVEVFNRTNGMRLDGSKLELVKTPEKTYFIQDLEQLLADLQLDHQLSWYRQSTRIINPMEPLVDLHVDCIHSLNIPTVQTLIFRDQKEFPDGEHEVVEGEGDGTVNLESLLVCQDWAAKLPHKVRHKVIKNTSHTGMLSHKSLLQHITDDVLIAK